MDRSEWVTMDLERTRRDLADALAAPGGTRDRLKAARRVIIRACLAALQAGTVPEQSLPSVIRRALASPDRGARRDCALLLLHALVVPGLVPADTYGDLCALMESALRTPLLRCLYPFGGAIDDRILVLRRLHTRIGELMEPLEPTFPSWPGLYAG